MQAAADVSLELQLNWQEQLYPELLLKSLSPSESIESHKHRLVWVGRNLKAHLVSTPCCGQGHFPLDQFAPSLTQAGLDTPRCRTGSWSC